MSFSDRLMLWFHVAFVVFTIGPVTLAIMSSPRAIRRRDTAVLRYLMWMTRIFGAASLGVFAFGMVLGQSLKDLGKAWLTVSMTLFVVAIVLLVLITRDQRRALAALEAAAEGQPPLAAARAAAVRAQDQPASGATAAAPEAADGGGEAPGGAQPSGDPALSAGLAHVATVERGRIASLAGVVSLIWLAILVLMIWNS